MLQLFELPIIKPDTATVTTITLVTHWFDNFDFDFDSLYKLPKSICILESLWAHRTQLTNLCCKLIKCVIMLHTTWIFVQNTSILGRQFVTADKKKHCNGNVRWFCFWFWFVHVSYERLKTRFYIYVYIQYIEQTELDQLFAVFYVIFLL